MPILQNCVVIGDKVYCYDATSKKCVEAVLAPKPDSAVPEEAEKLIAMRRFNLVERAQ